MSFLNSLGSALSAVGAAGLQDAADTAARKPLLNTAVPAVAPAASPGLEKVPAEVSASSADVPSEYLPIYQDASKRTGIPIDILIAQAKQESGFRANAVGKDGEIGLHQILPSTARDPGYGMRGVDPDTLKDAAANINFAADYLKARAGPNADFSNPAHVNMALSAYNGGGDPNYVANVRRNMKRPIMLAGNRDPDFPIRRPDPYPAPSIPEPRTAPPGYADTPYGFVPLKIWEDYLQKTRGAA